MESKCNDALLLLAANCFCGNLWVVWHVAKWASRLELGLHLRRRAATGIWEPEFGMGEA